ncbi:hypothetical protein D3C72_1832960 [compost metagenome]
MSLAIESPTPHCLPHPLQGTLAGSRQEAGKRRPPLRAARLPRPKRKTEKRKARMQMAFAAVAVSAVHDLRFLRMHRQPTSCQPCCNGPHHVFRLPAAIAVNHRIIRVAGKRTVWAGALHPSVECVVHEQVHQDRTDHTALGCAPRAGHTYPVRCLEWCNQPPFDV